MRVAFIGNMNNWFFAHVRHLRDRGIDAHLFLTGDEGMIFDPSFDTFDLSHREYTHRVAMSDPLALFDVSPEHIKRTFQGFDVLVGCGAVPAYMANAGLRLDAFWPFGSDLTEYPFMRPRLPRRSELSAFLAFRRLQRKGIRQSRAYIGMYDKTHADALDRIGRTEGERSWLPVIPLYTPPFAPEAIESTRARSSWWPEFSRVRESADVVVYHAARHVWASRTTPLNRKANDRLLRAFARARRERPNVRMRLVTHEIGLDVTASRMLCAELGISDAVDWFPAMGRKDVMCGLAMADVAATEFAHSWNFSGVVGEALAVGVPVLQHRRDAEFPAEDLYPTLHACSEDEIVSQLKTCADSPDTLKSIGSEARSWFLKRIVDEPLQKWDGFLQSVRKS